MPNYKTRSNKNSPKTKGMIVLLNPNKKGRNWMLGYPYWMIRN